MRLFVALDIPESVRERLAMLSTGLPGARWLLPEQLHLTLRFIGEVEGGLFLDIREALAEVVCSSFTLRLEGVGFFPPRKKPQVVWAGLSSDEKVRVLRNRIETKLVQVGLEPEKRKFAPHVTLARLHNTPSCKVGEFLERNCLFISPEFTVREFFLCSSVLNPRGARYFVEQEYRLD